RAGEDENVSVSRGDEQMLNEILVTRLHPGAALTAAALLTIGRDRGALQVPTMADGDCHLLVGNQVLELDLGSFVFDDGAPLVAILLLDLFEFTDDDLAQLLFRAQDRLVLGNVLAGSV